MRVHIRDESSARSQETERLLATVGHADNFPGIHLEYVLHRMGKEPDGHDEAHATALELHTLSRATGRFFLGKTREQPTIAESSVFDLRSFLEREEFYFCQLARDIE